MKVERLLSIILFLLNRNKVTANELAEHFEVSQRTIQRDIAALCSAGVPICANQGSSGGYSIMEGYTVNRHFLAPKELDHLSALLSGFNRVAGHESLRLAQEKLQNLLGREGQCGKHEKLIVDFMPWGMEEAQSEVFRTIFQATDGNICLNLEYIDSEGNTINLSVEPLSVVMQGFSWSLYVYCHSYKSERLLKISRVLKAKATGESFAPELRKSYDEMRQNQTSPYKERLFVLKFAPEAVGRVTEYYHPDRLHKMPDGSFIGLFMLQDAEWIYSWICSFGSMVEVLEPPHVRERLRHVAASLSGKYEA